MIKGAGSRPRPLFLGRGCDAIIAAMQAYLLRYSGQRYGMQLKIVLTECRSCRANWCSV